MKSNGMLKLTVSILLCAAAAATLIPWPKAAETCVLGYKSLCSFAPVSTVILLFAAKTLHDLMGRKAAEKE